MTYVDALIDAVDRETAGLPEGTSESITVSGLRALVGEIKRLRTAQEWQDISTAPKDGSRFLVATTQGLVHEAYYLDNSLTPWPWKGIKPSSQTVVLNLFKPVLWQPLPAPPVAVIADDRGTS